MGHQHSSQHPAGALAALLQQLPAPWRRAAQVHGAHEPGVWLMMHLPAKFSMASEQEENVQNSRRRPPCSWHPSVLLQLTVSDAHQSVMRTCMAASCVLLQQVAGLVTVMILPGPAAFKHTLYQLSLSTLATAVSPQGTSKVLLHHCLAHKHALYAAGG